jgi:hypothetical protein
MPQVTGVYAQRAELFRGKGHQKEAFNAVLGEILQVFLKQ